MGYLFCFNGNQEKEGRLDEVQEEVTEFSDQEILDNYQKYTQRVIEYQDGNLLEFFDKPPNPGPNPLQAELIEAWLDPIYKVFTYTGANRIGKCVTYQTLIETPDGDVPIGTLFENQEPFDVYAWNGEKRVVAKASPPFKKDGLHQCFEFTMSDGQRLGLADNHRILLSSG